MLADAAVVPDLHEIVDLRAGADARAARLRAVDARVRADLDVVFEHHVSDLRDSFRSALDERPAEAVAADDAAGVQHDAVADDAVPDMTRRVRMQPDRLADRNAVTDVRAGAHDASAPRSRRDCRRKRARRRTRRRRAARPVRSPRSGGERDRAVAADAKLPAARPKRWRAFSTTSSGLPRTSCANEASTKTAAAAARKRGGEIRSSRSRTSARHR